MSFEDRLGYLVEQEYTERANRRLHNRLRQASLKQQASMEKTRPGDGRKYLHRKAITYREKYFKKLRTYEIYVQLGFIAQGILQYLSLTQSKLVWRNFGSWIRTIRPNVLPTEMVVGMALRE